MACNIPVGARKKALVLHFEREEVDDMLWSFPDVSSHGSTASATGSASGTTTLEYDAARVFRTECQLMTNCTRRARAPKSPLSEYTRAYHWQIRIKLVTSPLLISGDAGSVEQFG